MICLPRVGTVAEEEDWKQRFKGLEMHKAVLTCCFAIVSGAGTVARAEEIAGEMSIWVVAPRPERAFATMSAQTIADALPGTTPIKLLSGMPGVSYTGSEDIGNYEWGNDIAIRGFTAGQVGWMLDDIPLGSTHYWYNNGLDMHRAISPENIARLSLVPGGGSPELASINALGAGVLAATSAPARETEFRAQVTAGSHNTWRGFFRADTGTFAHGGRGYLSLASLSAGKWKGMGAPGQEPFAIFGRDDGDAVTGADGRWGNYHDQWNFKWIQPLGPHRLTLWADVSDKRENDYADLLVKDYRQHGRHLDNWTRWQDALSGDETVLYGSGASWRYDTLLAATAKARLNEHIWISATPYRHEDEGNGDWHMPFIDDSVVNDVKFRRSKLDLERTGVNLRITSSLGNHELSAGLWREESTFLRRRFNYDLYDWPSAPDVDLGSIDRVLMDRRYDMSIAQAHVQDRYLLPDDRWSLLLGVKTMRVESDFVDKQGIYPSNRLISRGDFLPQVGVSFSPNDSDEIFVDYAANINAKPLTVFTQSVFDDNFKPERSDTLEGGWRHGGPTRSVAVSAYYIHYGNRLLQIANCSLLGTCPSLLANVGDVVSRGTEGRWRWQVAPGWRWSGSLSYNDARYEHNYVSDGEAVRTRGKRVVNSPNWLIYSELRRDRGPWHVAADVQHTGRRSASYTGDLQIPAFTVWNLSVGYARKDWPAGVRNGSIRLQVRNLFDSAYISTLGASGFYASDPDGSQTYVQAGAPRGVYLTVYADY